MAASPLPLSALIVARNAAAELGDCLSTLGFAREIVVVLDRTTDGSRAIAEGFGAKILEGGWPIEGDRREAGIAACTQEWILEVDADERVTEALAREIGGVLHGAGPGYFLIPYANHIGGRLIRHGWGAYNGISMKPALFSRGAKRWGRQRVHPKIELTGERRRLTQPMLHFVDRDLHDTWDRLNRYSSLQARQLRADGRIGTLAPNLRRMVTRFWKSYVGRRGYREGVYGLVLGLFSALYPILSYLKARADEDAGKPLDSRDDSKVRKRTAESESHEC
ncbi:MAG: glycosyltransferase family 2 protein [Proteobacteria bacterium]|nr:glycosyltransferase family 2 protein [Pseudomonadota bacterium]MBI3498886.1 glycosyltransferase family 2 protein [Pseudomonadota bacterium]